jgi:hypothetical protein
MKRIPRSFAAWLWFAAPLLGGVALVPATVHAEVDGSCARCGRWVKISDQGIGFDRTWVGLCDQCLAEGIRCDEAYDAVDRARAAAEGARDSAMAAARGTYTSPVVRAVVTRIAQGVVDRMNERLSDHARQEDALDDHCPGTGTSRPRRSHRGPARPGGAAPPGGSTSPEDRRSGEPPGGTAAPPSGGASSGGAPGTAPGSAPGASSSRPTRLAYLRHVGTPEVSRMSDRLRRAMAEATPTPLGVEGVPLETAYAAAIGAWTRPLSEAFASPEPAAAPPAGAPEAGAGPIGELAQVPPVDVRSGLPEDRLAESLERFHRHAAQAAAFANALSATRGRALAAAAAKDAAAERRQLAHALILAARGQKYAQEAETDLTRLAQLLLARGSDLDRAAREAKRDPSDLLAEAVARVKAEGFPRAYVEKLEGLGVPKEAVDRLRRRVEATDAAEAAALHRAFSAVVYPQIAVFPGDHADWDLEAIDVLGVTSRLPPAGK